MENVDKIKVLKCDGSYEPFTLDKVHRMCEWGAEGLNVSVSQIEMSLHNQLYDGISTSEVHNIIIKAAADLISPDTPDYQYFAARLLMFRLRKTAYGSFTPPKLYSHIIALVEEGIYDSTLAAAYSEAAINEFERTYVDHGKDMDYAYAAVKQFEGKYLFQNRADKLVRETPQMAYACMALALYSSYLLEGRISERRALELAGSFYQGSTSNRFSLPTPVMSGVRTALRQYSSCVLVDSGDSLASIKSAGNTIIDYVAKRAGIGLNVGRIRGDGAPVRSGEVVSTGLIPYIKYFRGCVKCCSQGGVRGGAATLYFPMWHWEIEKLMVLKNNRGVEENRERHLDYTVQINKTLYKRLINGENITLFQPNEVEDLYEVFFSNQEEFERLYVEYEKDPTKTKKTVNALELFTTLAQERSQTSRIYIMNVDNVNENSPFNCELAPVYMSNLCLEVALPTKPSTSPKLDDGEVALCTLAAFNLGKVDVDSKTGLIQLEEDCYTVVSALDTLLDYQEYATDAARTSTMKYRPLGIGVTNYAYYLAKHGCKYSDGSANNLTHRTFEAIQYYLIKASVQLAKERGCPEGFKNTNWAVPSRCLPIDRYNARVDDLHTEELRMDWEALRKDVLQYGIRNCTLTALMPSETSSQICNAVNGIEPPRGLVSAKRSKDGILKQVVPDVEILADKYELAWDMPDNFGYINLVAIMQKFVCQTISANTYHKPSKHPNGKLPVKLVLKELLYAWRHGVKTFYYHNTEDGSGENVEDGMTKDDKVATLLKPVVIEEEDDCSSGACKI